ncbi:diguanylate cyclase (GGDEF)-like protein [Actimicrobium sp. GrIS 1.19]|uniref:sensor domain-containing diguanylate cyclase n=1 Tax=Actimicrobium sp. GrIS 1.19 TaxID=3071708 RepID=UPI002DFEAD71|nr:diguanylate cyclase (GGDEF)-like protein [Actimicrobium sp. GrIS 1.19]
MQKHDLFTLTPWLRKIGIRYRLMGSFIILSLLPLLASGLISYQESTKAIQSNTRIFATEVIKQVAKNVRLQMAQIDAASEAVVLSDPVQAALANFTDDDPLHRARARIELTRILLNTYGSFAHFNQKYFLDNTYRIIDSQVFPQLAGTVEELVEKSPHPKTRTYWTTLQTSVGQSSVVMVRDIYLKNSGRPAGSLFLGLQPGYFSNIFNDVDLGADSDVVIVDAGSGNILIASGENPARVSTLRLDQTLLADIRSNMAKQEQHGFLTYTAHPPANQGAGEHGVQFVAAYTQISGTEWFVVSIIPYNNLLVQAQSVRNKMAVIGLICFFGSIGLAFIISRTISSPLEKLVGVMKRTETGDYAIRMETEGNDELSVLTQKFNDMAERIGFDYEQLEARVASRTHALEEANQKLATLSMTDGLTGIANRRRFDEVLLAELSRAARSKKPVALIMLDIDYFKNYNDYYGHQDGDICLRKVARMLQSHARRSTDLVARYGGEEFVMLAPDTDVDSAMDVAESMRAGLQALALPHARTPLAVACVTASFGVVALVPDEEQSPELFARMADKAMYRAKEQGRNRVMLAGREAHSDPDRARAS